MNPRPARVRAVCFDFDQTLGYVEPSHLALYVQAAAEYGVAVTEDDFTAHLDDAWERWRTPLGIDHSAASADEASFRAVRVAVHLARLHAIGVEAAMSAAIAARIEELESQPRHYRLFDDSLPALERLGRAGVSALVVSNHLWRLPEILDALGAGPHLHAVLTSARAGYRKPHPRIYQAALRCAGCEPARVLFVGDSPSHDVEGPRAAGMRAVLLDRAGRHGDARAIRSLDDLRLT